MKFKYLAGAVVVIGATVMTASAKAPGPKLASITCFNLEKANASVMKLDSKVVQYTVNPGGKPGDLELEFEGVSRMFVNMAGNLAMVMQNGESRTYRATFYQTINGKRKLISGNFLVKGSHRASFQVGKYESSLPLQIDAQINTSSSATRG